VLGVVVVFVLTCVGNFNGRNNATGKNDCNESANICLVDVITASPGPDANASTESTPSLVIKLSGEKDEEEEEEGKEAWSNMKSL
jgi:hypothetical protein